MNEKNITQIKRMERKRVSYLVDSVRSSHYDYDKRKSSLKMESQKF